jgi:flagellar motor switch protein FliN
VTEPIRNPNETAPAARTVKLPELTRADAAGKPVFAGNLELIQNVKVQLGVSLGVAEMTVAELFALKAGSVVALQQPSDAPIDIVLDGRLIGRGELVVVGDNFGVRITEIGPAS